MLSFLASSICKGTSLRPGQYLRPNEYLCSENKQYCLLFQAQDNNVVLYRIHDFQPIWQSQTSTDTTSLGCLIMQRNGNLVLTRQSGTTAVVAWASHTGSPTYDVACAELRNDGSLVIGMPNQIIWLRGNQYVRNQLITAQQSGWQVGSANGHYELVIRTRSAN